MQRLGTVPEATELVRGRARTRTQMCLIQSPGTSVPGKAIGDQQPVWGLDSSLPGTTDAKLTKHHVENKDWSLPLSIGR